MRRIRTQFSGDGVKARALRGGGMLVLDFGSSSVMRLLSNLILTRLLAPEAFGLMALVYMVMTALEMFSDIGVTSSVIFHERGDEPDFLNTAWTLQTIRGVVLWLAAAVLSPALAYFYDEPALVYLLPVAAVQTLLMGARSSNALSARRHMRLGRLTAIILVSRLSGVFSSIVLTIWLQSVWGPVLGVLVNHTVMLILSYTALKGIRNRFLWDRAAVRSILGFGSFLFLSTLSGFLLTQGDRAILGKLLATSQLGIYSIGMLFGSLPLLLVEQLIQQLLNPIYRMKPPAESEANRRALRRTRLLLFGTMQAGNVLLAFGGGVLIETLYDETYHLAGPMVSLFAITLIPRMTGTDYNCASLAAGDSRSQFIVQLSASILFSASIIIGFHIAGLLGAILGQGLSGILVYPIRAYVGHKYSALDWRGDMLMFAGAASFALIAVWVHWDSYLELLN